MRSLVLMGLIAATAVAGAAGMMVELNPVHTHPHGTTPAVAQYLVVKLRPEASVTAPQSPPLQRAHARVIALAARHGLTLIDHRPVTDLIHALRVEPTAGEAATATLARLRADAEVAYAVLDERRYVHAVPNDTLYPQQWYLQTSAQTPSAIDAQDAWDTTTGGASLVIADIDTGVRPDHPDLAGRLLPGYCFISNAFVSNGGSCPGFGAADPGDWVTSTDISSNSAMCGKATAGPSSWHGTRTAGILGAATNNGAGVAGITWSAQILPVRALGKCGGFDSDIVSGMLWAAGIQVTGAPPNPNPAKIINMSLGGTGACTALYQDAVDQVRATGALVVVSAGNDGGPVDTPANCQGVAAVAGLRQAGTKVGYSNLGPEVALAAPAGNCGNAFTGGQTACIYSMTTTTNLSTTSPPVAPAPDPNDYTGLYYCDASTGSFPNCSVAAAGQYRTYNIGTSFSAPAVSGIAALMSSVNSHLNSCQLIARLKEGAQAFPQTSLDAAVQPPMCHVPSGASDVQGSECICTRDGQTCGAGMANAPRSLIAALRPIAAVALPASVTPGATVALDGSGSGAAPGHNVASYQWSPVSGGLTLSITGASTAQAAVTAPSCGVATVALTVTDDAGHSDTADVVITPDSVASAAPAAAGQSACPAAAPAVVVAVCPASSSVQTGATDAMTATLANTTDTSVTWEVNGVAGGNATVGTVSSSGVYTAPAAAPSPATVSVSAVSSADPSSSGSVQLTITAPAGGGGGGGGGGAMDWITVLAGAARRAQVGSRRRALR